MDEHAAAEGHSPLEQFEIIRLIEIDLAGFDMSFTNSALYMVVAMLGITTLLLVGTRKRALVPGPLQAIVEMSYEFVANLIRENVGPEGRQYFPFVFSLFMFILFLNMIGMIPYTFTVTSHIIVTFALAAVVFIGVMIIGFARHGLGYFRIFVPSGVGIGFLLILVPIEIISYFTRPLSLSVRLFANMLAGHTMLKVFGGFVISLGAISYGILGVVPLVMIIAFTALELLVAFLQAYVFAILTCIYLNDAIHMEH